MYDNPALLASATLRFLPPPYLLTGALVQLICGPGHRYRTNMPTAAVSIAAGWSIAVLLPVPPALPAT